MSDSDLLEISFIFPIKLLVLTRKCRLLLILHWSTNWQCTQSFYYSLYLKALGILFLCLDCVDSSVQNSWLYRVSKLHLVTFTSLLIPCNPIQYNTEHYTGLWHINISTEAVG